MASNNVLRGSGGGGKGGGSPRQAVEDPDTLHSVQYAQVLDAVSEGEIVGLVAGHESIFYNETPLMNTNGTYNFDNVKTYSVMGTTDQEVIPDAGSIRGQEAVQAEIKKGVGTAPPITIYNGDLDAIAVTISCNQLTTQDKENGDIHGAKVDYEIYLMYNNDSNWHKVVSASFDGKTTSKYTRQHRINLDKTIYSTEVTIKILRLTDEASDSALNDTIYWESFTRIIDNKLRYPHTALIATQINARQFSSIPKRAYHIRGIKCKVPTNYHGYDPDTLAAGDNLYSGHWDGTFNNVMWTSNPAWIYYDIITNKRYGLGEYIRGTQIDKWALYQIARYCDAVDDAGDFVGVKSGFKDAAGATLLEPRFACNVYIQDQQEAIKVIQDLAFAFRGLSYWANGQLVPVQDSPKEPTQLFTSANVLGGEFSYSGTSQKARKTVALVNWNDPDDFYRRKVEYVEDREGVDRYGIRKTDITSFGCTSRGQAHRIGTWTLLTDTLETETLSFKSGLEAAVLRPGDLIKVQDPTRSGNRYGGRIKSGSTKTNIILDSAVQMLPGANYTLNVIHTDKACLKPQESSPGVAHPHAGELYYPTAPVAGLEAKEVCISDGGQWAPYLFVENYPVTIDSLVTEDIDLDTEISASEGGTGVPGTPFSIYDSKMSFSSKYLGRTVTNKTTGATATITNIVADHEVHVDVTSFASAPDSIEYHHSLTNEPKADYMWLLEETGVVDAQVWRTVGVKESKKNEYEVLAMEYHEDKYRIIEEGLDFSELDERNISNVPNILVATPPPADLDVYETSYVGSDGQVRNKVIIQWQAPTDYPYIRLYSVKYRVNKGTWVDLPDTEFLNTEVLDAPKGTYEVKVRAQSIITNNVSMYVQVSKTVLGLAKPPSSVTKYCSGLTYARTQSDCEGQGRCSTLDGSSILNSEALCTAQSPIDPATGAIVSDETRCGDLNHSWVSNACVGQWVSDGNVWTTDSSKFTITTDKSTGTRLDWEPIKDLDLRYYEIQEGSTWGDASNTVLLKENSLSFGAEGGWYLKAGTHNFLLRAKDTSGVYSTYDAEASIEVTVPDPATSLTYSFVGTNVVISWVPGVNSFYKINEYDIRYGDTWSSNYAARIHNLGAPSISINVGWGGTRKYWVAPEDMAENYGAPASIDILVESPDWSTNPVVHTLDSTGAAVLSWVSPTIGSLPISNYEIRQGGLTGDSATLVGLIKTTTHSENVTWGPSSGEPSRDFWVRAIDSAGNLSPWQKHSVEIRNPVDIKDLAYTLVGPDQVTNWRVQTAGEADYDNNVDYLLPVKFWEIKKGDTYGSATILSPRKSSTRYSEKVTWGGGQFRRYWVTSIDSAGNKGTNHSIDITINNPAIPYGVTYSISGGNTTIKWSAPSADLDIVEYELRSGATWAKRLDNTANSAITRALTLDHTLRVDWRPYDPANNIDDTRFFVRAIDSAGNYSEEPVHSVQAEGTGWVLAEVERLGQVQSLSNSFIGIMTLLSWTAPVHAGDSAGGYLPVDLYEIRDSTGAVLKTTYSTSYSTPVTWHSGSPVTFTIVAKDSAGNYGVATDIAVDVPVPDAPATLNIKVVDNNVLLRWPSASNVAKLDINSYEVKRCPDGSPSCSSSTEAEWGVLEPVSTTAGLFISHMETIGGTFKYWIRSVDSAGNMSPALSTVAIVSEPPDFILIENRNSTLDEDNPASYPTEVTTIETTSIHKGATSAFLPVNTVETWREHFVNNSFTSPQSQVSAGYPFYLEPGTSSASFWQKWDFGVTLDPSSIQAAMNTRVLHGAVTPSTTLYYSNTDPDAGVLTNETGWTKVVGTSTMALHTFRYVKAHTVFNTDGGNNDLMALDEFKLKLSLKMVTDSGSETVDTNSGLCNVYGSGEDGAPFYYTDGAGISRQPDNNEVICNTQGGEWHSTKEGMKVFRVFFLKDFKDINYLNTAYTTELDGSVVPSRFTIHDFEDVPTPSFFYVYILDKSDYGTLTGAIKSFEGKLTWNARGVQ